MLHWQQACKTDGFCVSFLSPFCSIKKFSTSWTPYASSISSLHYMMKLLSSIMDNRVTIFKVETFQFSKFENASQTFYIQTPVLSNIDKYR
jgi:hypothetical protein